MIRDKLVTKDYLEEQYYKLGKSTWKIAKELNTSQTNIRNWLKSFLSPLKKCGRVRENLIGKRFGQLVVIEEFRSSDKKHPLWKCKCDCGKFVNTSITNLQINQTQSCTSCGRERGAKKRWKGFGNISGQYWANIKWGAKSRNLVFNITKETAWNLFQQQNGICALSGCSIAIHKNKLLESTASLDRIDSSKGYTIDNIQWVHKKLNIMKQDMSDSEFISWCSLVTTFNKDKSPK